MLNPGWARLRLAGRDWVDIGRSEDTFEMHGATPQVVSIGFGAIDDNGDPIEIPEGVCLSLHGFEHARRIPHDYVDHDGFSRTRFSFVLPVAVPIYAWNLATVEVGGAGHYRQGAARRLVGNALIVAAAQDLSAPPKSLTPPNRARVIVFIALGIVALGLMMLVALIAR